MRYSAHFVAALSTIAIIFLAGPVSAHFIAANRLESAGIPAIKQPAVVTPNASSSASASTTTAPTAAAPKSTTKAPAAAAPTATQPVPASAPTPGNSVTNLTPTPPADGGSNSGSNNPTPPPSGYSSTNWSGYLSTAGSFSAVSGSWAVPHVTGNGSSTTADGTWIGIGGVNTNDLIQVGTENTVAANGQVSTFPFYELLPASAQLVTGMSVTAGDAISASITKLTATQWNITIHDNTNARSFTTTVSYSSSLSSAEWIEEDPSFSNGNLVPFDSFGSVSFSHAGATLNGNSANLNGSSAQIVTLVNNANQPVATPTAIGSDGASFSVNRN